MSDYQLILVDDVAPGVRRITLNRPEKRNAISNQLRAEVFRALEDADVDDAVRVTVIRGAGKCFSSGYDLKSDLASDLPYHTARGAGMFSRHFVEGWTRLWDLAKPVIAQVHGYCMAGGSELATACDLVYVAEDAEIGYPMVRMIAPPDMQYFPWLVGMRQAMELMLTGDSIDGRRAAEIGFANRAFPAEELEARVLELAERVARVPSDLQQVNKRGVHRAMEIMGIRTALRVASELQGIAVQLPSVQAAFGDVAASARQAFGKKE